MHCSPFNFQPQQQQ